MDYRALTQTHPALFDNENALLKIILDPALIENWEAEKKRELEQKQLPVEWSKIGIILDDPYNVIARDLVQFPDGAMRGYGRSIAAASLTGGRGVAILPEYNGRILLLHQYRHATRQWHYEIPRGYGEPNIPPEANARKEIEEETGGQVAELVSLGEFHSNTGWEAVPVSLYHAKLSSVGAADINEGIESFAWLTARELEDWIAVEKITDGFTIAAYIKARLKGLLKA